MRRYLARVYVWLICRDRCLCALRMGWAERLCGRIDVYLFRHTLI